MPSTPALSDGVLTIKRPFFSFLDRTFRVMDGAGNLVAFVRHPLLKLREQFKVFADEGMASPLATIQARQMIAINFAYDVRDPLNDAWLGTLRSRGLKSIIRDTWDLLDQAEQLIGTMEETGHSLLRRFVPILPGHWAVTVGGVEVARIDQVFRFFVKEYQLTIAVQGQHVDRRYLLACALLALMRENRREEQN
jgi:hypothetical protein